MCLVEYIIGVIVYYENKNCNRRTVKCTYY